MHLLDLRLFFKKHHEMVEDGLKCHWFVEHLDSLDFIGGHLIYSMVKGSDECSKSLSGHMSQILQVKSLEQAVIWEMW